MVKLQVYASLVLTLATSSAVSLALRPVPHYGKGIHLPGRQHDRDRDIDYLDARDTYDDLEARDFFKSLGEKLKNKLKSPNSSKISKPSQTFSHTPQLPSNDHYPVYHDPRLEDHLVKTAGILWGLRRRDFDAELEELFGRDMDFLVGRFAFDDLD